MFASSIMQYIKPFFNLLEIWQKYNFTMLSILAFEPCFVLHQDRTLAGHLLSLEPPCCSLKNQQNKVHTYLLEIGKKGPKPYHALYCPAEFCSSFSVMRTLVAAATHTADRLHSCTLLLHFRAIKKHITGRTGLIHSC